MSMNFDFTCENLSLEGVKLITPFYQEDNRGFFMKSFEKEIFQNWGIDINIWEKFESFSSKGVIRGMHFQTFKPQAKLVQVLVGTVLDIVIDIRKESETFGKFLCIELSDENHKILYIPEGFAHGFEVLSDKALMEYQCCNKYRSGYDSGIIWNDPELNLPWKTKNPLVSDRDKKNMSFREYREMC